MHPQAAFARALLDPLAPCPPGLRRAGDADPAQRYAIYRNNVVASLIQALALPGRHGAAGIPAGAGLLRRGRRRAGRGG
ncbi:DNA-binding domain-containing protein, partial [Bordetella pertussis]|uniref:DNA-binding domain-containing protein n=1 Tax=Bordetella pertussis TaxID=520 RepID=UPI0021B7CF94